MKTLASLDVDADISLTFTETCAICLEGYQIGDVVVWSTGCDHGTY